MSEVEPLDDWLAALEERGYAAVFKRRHGKKYANLIAYKTSKYRLLRAAACDMDDLASLVASKGGAGGGAGGGEGATTPAARGIAGAATDYSRSCIAVFAALVPVDAEAPTRGIVVSSTHLFWDPAYTHVRTAQAAMLQLCGLEFAAAVALAHPAPGGGDALGTDALAAWPLFLAGDFNMQPCTGPYRLVTEADVSSLVHALLQQSPAEAQARVAGWDCIAYPDPLNSLARLPATAVSGGLSMSAAAGAAAAAAPSEAPLLGAAATPSPASPAFASPLPPPQTSMRAIAPAWVSRLREWVCETIACVGSRALAQLPRADYSPDGAPPPPQAASAAADSTAPALPLLRFRSAYAEEARKAGGGGGGGGAGGGGGGGAGAAVVTATSTGPVARGTVAQKLPALEYGDYEPAFTNYTESFKATLDYVFFLPLVRSAEVPASQSSDGSAAVAAAPASLATPAVQSVLAVPTELELLHKGLVGIPSAEYPSDHVPVSATFTL